MWVVAYKGERRSERGSIKPGCEKMNKYDKYDN